MFSCTVAAYLYSVLWPIKRLCRLGDLRVYVRGLRSVLLRCCASTLSYLAKGAAIAVTIPSIFLSQLLSLIVP